MKSEHIIQGAIAGMLAAGFAFAANDTVGTVPVPTPVPGDFEKCGGIAKAGKNDCGTSVSSCAATAKADREAEVWVLLPKGTCDRISGGKIQASPFARPGGKTGTLSPAAKAAMAGTS